MVQVLGFVTTDHPVYDMLFAISIIAAVASGFYFRKQTIMMKKQLCITQHEADLRTRAAENMQDRVNDEIMGYASSPGVMAKMGLTERVFLLDQKATALDRKTDLQNIVINSTAETVKQLLPNGGTSLADKINQMGIVLTEHTVHLTNTTDKLNAHIEASQSHPE